jgi:transposase
MAPSADSLPTDLASAHAMIIATREALLAAEARASAAESEAKHLALLIEKLKYTIAKLRHDKFGQSSERGAILEQLELALAEMEEDAAQAETAAQMAAAAAKIEVRSFERRKPARRPLPEHLPRERIVYPAPAVCPCCGGALHKIGEDVTETLEPHPTPVEGDPARAREVLLPLLQKHHPAAGVIASDLARGRAGPLLPARPKQQASRATSGQLCRPDAGRCVCRLQ